MKFVLILLVALGFCQSGSAWFGFRRRPRDHQIDTSLPVRVGNGGPRQKWFTQILDHYNPLDTRSWKQRYYVNDDYYREGGPSFLMVGGEQTAYSAWLYEDVSLEMYLAKKYGAKVYYLEHRYYGMSRPTTNLSLDNLLYLNADQALADTANFIDEMQSLENVDQTNKWILFGASYAGSLVTWMRAKYPHLVYGAIANSAPLLAQIDFKDFYLVIQKVLKQHSSNCVNTLATAFIKIHYHLSNPVGLELLEGLFKVCGTHFQNGTTTFDRINFYEGIVDITTDIVFNNDTSSLTVEKACNILEDETLGEPVKRLAHLNDVLLKEKNESCLALVKYDDTVRRLRKTSWDDSDNWDRRWIYQTCTEFGWFETTTARPFNISSTAIPVEMYKKLCTDVFGYKHKHVLEYGVNRTNAVFGGMKIADEVTNIVFIHGSNDPWHAAGVTKTTNSKSPVIFVQGGGHSPLIYPPKESDSSYKAEAKRKLEKIIKNWLSST